MTGTVQLCDFKNDWYSPGRALPIRIAWIAVNRLFLATSFPWPSRLKATLLRVFGAHIGKRVVLKPRINIKYPWRLSIGDHSWVGEGVWLDTIGDVRVGSNVCLSQGAMIETGNHDWTKPAFDLIVKEVTVEDGAWVAVRAMLLPGATLARQAVLGAGSVLSGGTEPSCIYAGVPARKVRERLVSE